MRAFPQNHKHLNIDLQWSNSIIGKFEEGSSKFSNIRKIRKKQMKDAKEGETLKLHEHQGLFITKVRNLFR